MHAHSLAKAHTFLHQHQILILSVLAEIIQKGSHPSDTHTSLGRGPITKPKALEKHTWASHGHSFYLCQGTKEKSVLFCSSSIPGF